MVHCGAEDGVEIFSLEQLSVVLEARATAADDPLRFIHARLRDGADGGECDVVLLGELLAEADVGVPALAAHAHEPEHDPVVGPDAAGGRQGRPIEKLSTDP